LLVHYPGKGTSLPLARTTYTGHHMGWNWWQTLLFIMSEEIVLETLVLTI